MDKPKALERESRVLVINIEINEVESETLRVASVAELNAKVGVFFENYNIHELLLQAKIKRRILASYNRMIKEANLLAAQKRPVEKKPMPQHSLTQKASQKEQPKKQQSTVSLKAKQPTMPLGFKFGIGSAAFLKNYTFGKRCDTGDGDSRHEERYPPRAPKGLTQTRNSSNAIERPLNLYEGDKTDANWFANSTRNGFKRAPVNQPTYLMPPTQTDAFAEPTRLFDDPRPRYDPHLQRSNAKSGDAQLSKTELYPKQPPREKDNNWIISQFPSPAILGDRRGPPFKEAGLTRSFADEGLATLEKTSKKPPLELSLDRRTTDFNHQLNETGPVPGHMKPTLGRYLSIRDPVPVFGRGGSQGPQTSERSKPLTATEIFELLDGMRIGLISQKNLNISALSVSYLKRLQPLIAKIYSGDETSFFDFKDFQKMLVGLRIDLSEAN